jgi:hypothetical protein
MSGPRATVYAFGLTVIALFAFYVDAEAKEIAMWQAALGAAIPFFALVLAFVRTLPRKRKVDSDNA